MSGLNYNLNDKEELENLDEHELKKRFSKLYNKLRKKVKNNNISYYFVIDGLDRIPKGFGEETILDLLPTGYDYGIYVLTSSTEKNYNFDYFTWLMLWFSKDETEKLLNEYMTNEQIDTVHNVCNGLPKYVCELHRQLSKGANVEKLIENLPSNFHKLLEKEWDKINCSDENVINLLAVLVFSYDFHTTGSLSQILNIDIEKIKHIIESIEFIKIYHNKHVKVVDEYKVFLQEKLDNKKTYIIEKLINYYKSNDSYSAFINLPILYKAMDNFEAMVSLLDVNTLVDFLGRTKKVSLVRRSIRMLSEMAYQKNDTKILAWGALAESVFSKIISSPPAVENEIRALLALGYNDRALNYAYKTMLPEDRLKLLSHICNYMWENGIYICEDIINIIEESIDLIDSSIELTKEVVEKLLEVCTNIFPIRADLAEKIFGRIAKENNQDDLKNNLMELIIMRLSHMLGPEDNPVDRMRDEINNESLYSFAEVASSTIAESSEEKILEQAAQIDNISAKLFLLQSWCNTNAKQGNDLKVVNYALNIMIENSNYTPTMQHLRQFSKPLIYCNNYELIESILKKFDNLKNVAIKNPIDEYVRLELTLAIIEYNFFGTDDRICSIYLYLDELSDYNSRCYVIVRILQTLTQLNDIDLSMKVYLENELRRSFDTLLETSAQQYKVTKGILVALINYDKDIAIFFAQKLNVEFRRDDATVKILRTYINNFDSQVLDFKFIFESLSKIKNINKYEWTLVQILKKLTNYNCSHEFKLKFVQKVYDMRGLVPKSYALAYLLCWISNEDNNSVLNSIYDRLEDAIGKLSLTDQIQIGNKVVTIIAHTDREKAKSIFSNISDNKTKYYFTDNRLFYLYAKTCNLAIKCIPDIMKDSYYSENIDIFKNAISYIPSNFTRCSLLSELALRCLTSGRQDYFKYHAKICIDYFEKSIDEGEYEQLIINISPLLFQYERNYYYEKLKKLQHYIQDISIMNVISFVLSKRPPSDRVDIDRIVTNLDYSESIKICELIENMNQDFAIYKAISVLVDKIIIKKANDKQDTRLTEDQLLNIVQKLNDIIDNKLPDPINIQHFGYEICIRVCMCQLRDVAKSTTRFRAKKSWNKLCFTWDEIENQIKGHIDNTADKVLVFECAGVAAYNKNSEIGKRMLKNAENHLDKIYNHIDRAERFQLVAKGYSETSDNEAAKFLLNNAINTAQLCSHNEGRDQIIGHIIEIAHSIDYNLATDIASKVDSYAHRNQLNDNIKTLDLRSNPNNIEYYQAIEYNRIVNNALQKIMQSVNSNRATIQHENVIRKWLYCSLNQEFETVQLSINWFIENTVMSNQSKTSYLHNFFGEMVNMLNLLHNIDSVIMQQVASKEYIDQQSVLPNIKTFYKGQGDEAINFIKQWVIDNAMDYVIIYDPYFCENEVSILQSIPHKIRVQIFTSARIIELEDIQNRFKKSWNKVCDQLPPETQINVFATNSGKTTMHDRFIITNEAGLKLGTSINGFGNKDSTITFMDCEDKSEIENNLITKMFFYPNQVGDDERVQLMSFAL